MPKIPTDALSIQTGGAAAAQAQAEVARVNSLKGQKVHSEKEMEKAAKGFEALLLHQMMKSMWETVEQTGFLGEDSNQSQIMRDMFHQSVADEVAEGRGIGVKEMMLKEIRKQEEASQKGDGKKKSLPAL